MIPDLQSENIDKYCRTCLIELSSKMYDIFVDYSNAKTVADLLSSFNLINVDKNDLLPKKVCDRCYNLLVSFNDFRQQVENVDNRLKTILEQVPKELKQELLSSNNTVDEETKIENNAASYKEDSLHGLEDFRDDIDLSYENSISTPESVYPTKQNKTTKLICKICHKKFRKEMKYEAHLSKHMRELYKCTFCSDTFEQKHALIQHLVQHSQVKEEPFAVSKIIETNQTIECTICFASFKSVPALSAHMKVHVHKGRILSCNHCKKVFNKMSHLKRHEESHDVNRPYKCNVCPKSFTTENLLSEHTNRHFSIKPHTCVLCKKKFSNITSLTTHIKVHTRGKAYLCSTCGKKFDSKTNLNQHMKRHIGLKMFACNLCPRSFVSKGELKSHSNTHTGKKCYSCEQCGACYTSRSSLGKHKWRHLGIKPYQCETCATKFTSKDHLKRHSRIHTGEKPYHCDICDRAFTQSNDLVKHKRTHLGDKLYACTECPESFRYKTELRQHISEHYISSRLQAVNVHDGTQNDSDMNKIETVVAKDLTDANTGETPDVPMLLMTMSKESQLD